MTMRGLADVLGFKAMSLYNHVSGKPQLLELMADAAAVGLDVDVDLDPLGQVRSLALAVRRTFIAHPWAPELWLRTLPGPLRTAQMEAMLRAFAQSGLPDDLAHHGFHAVTNHVVGYSLQELSMPLDAADPDGAERANSYLAGLSDNEHPYTIAHVHQHLDGDTASSFELVLDLILDGLARRVDADGATAQ